MGRIPVAANAVRGAIASAFTALLLVTGPVSAAEPEIGGTALDVFVDQISNFRVGSSETRFGAFEFVGGLEVTSSSRMLGAISAIGTGPDGNDFYGVMDTGHWYSGRFERDSDGRLTGISGFRVSSMLDKNGQPDSEKYRMDAEGMAVRGDEILVSFERVHRVDVYPASHPEKSKPLRTIIPPIPAREYRSNRGMEAVTVAPPGTPLDGATVVFTEMSLNKAGDIFAAVLDGPRKGIFYVKRMPPFAITDGAFLPNGDLLLLERRFSIASGIGMRIVRVDGDTIRPGATVTGEVLLDAGFSNQIDNMEGMAVRTAADGSLRVLLVSDDNHSILQRNLFLEFKLVE